MTRLKNATLRDVCTLVTDGTHDTPKTLDSGVPFIKAKQINDGIIEFSDCEFISYEDHLKVISRSKPEKGDTLFAHIGASLGEAAYVNTDLEFSIKNVALFKPNHKIIVPRYLYYLVINNEFQDGIKNRRTGSAQPFVSLDILRTNPIRFIDDISTQRRISDILATYDDLIENNRHRIRILEQMIETIYQEWFEKGNKEWASAYIGDIVDLRRGKSYRSEDLAEEGGLPFITLKCIERDGGFRRDGIKRFTGEYKDINTAKAGNIVIALTDMTQERRLVARAARVPKTIEELYVLSMDLIRLEPKAGIPQSYLYAMLRFSKFPDEVKQHANGVNVLHLSPDRIAQFEFGLPPKLLRERFSEIAEPIFKECDLLENKNSNLRQTRDLLLPRLVSGEIELK